MEIKATTPDNYIAQIPEDRRAAMERLRKVIKENLPKGFNEEMNYGMIGYVVPHAIYPDGYHCDPKLPLPFMNIASQKNFIAIYHMGIYADPELMKWFVAEYPNYTKAKLDMGKSCIRFKKPADIPFDLIGELATKVSAQEWVNTYRNNIRR